MKINCYDRSEPNWLDSIHSAQSPSLSIELLIIKMKNKLTRVSVYESLCQNKCRRRIRCVVWLDFRSEKFRIVDRCKWATFGRIILFGNKWILIWKFRNDGVFKLMRWVYNFKFNMEQLNNVCVWTYSKHPLDHFAYPCGVVWVQCK